MGFGTPITEKPPRKSQTVRRITAEPMRTFRLDGAFVRIILLAVLSAAAAAYGMYLYYTHAFQPKPRPAPTAVPSGSEIWIDLSPEPSASAPKK